MTNANYRISPAIRRGFPLSRIWLQITKSVQWNFAIIRILPFLNNLKDLDPSYKMDLDFWNCLEGESLRLIIGEIRYWKSINKITDWLGIRDDHYPSGHTTSVQRWSLVEISSWGCFNVDSTLNIWRWKDVGISTLFQRWILISLQRCSTVDFHTMNQRWKKVRAST